MTKKGSIGWADITVADADGLRSFYEEVTGWKSSSHDMGDYSDFVMSQPEDGSGVAGICHARGANAGLPPQWLIYIVVESLERSLASVEKLGGRVLKRGGGSGAGGFFAVIEDPAGAACALFEPIS